jgi:hypothetical protein
MKLFSRLTPLQGRVGFWAMHILHLLLIALKINKKDGFKDHIIQGGKYPTPLTIYLFLVVASYKAFGRCLKIESWGLPSRVSRKSGPKVFLNLQGILSY